MDEDDRHVVEAMGRARVVVEGGKVIEVGEPMIEYCPLFSKYRDIQELSPQTIRENIESRIKDFGMCTPKRELRMRDFLSFGVSELMAMSVREGLIDCAVTVCDGAGTVVITEPELIQGIGGRISGVVTTSPIPQIMERIGRGNVLDPNTAVIDQVRGVELALELGHEKVGVTVAGAGEALEIRNRFGDRAVIFAVHTTGIGPEEAESLFKASDIVTACASLTIRQLGSERAVMKVGNKIPIYAVSDQGKEILERRLKEVERMGIDNKVDEELPRPLV